MSLFGRIPTAVTLAKRKVNISNISCHNCDGGLDDSGHSLLMCPFSNGALASIFNILIKQFDSINGLVDFAAQWGRCPKNENKIISIIYGFLCCVGMLKSSIKFNHLSNI